MTWDTVPSPRILAPSAFQAWEALTGCASRAVDGALIALICDRVAALLAPPDGASNDNASIAKGPALTEATQHDAAFASCQEAIEQFVIDVSAMTEAQRDAVSSALGAAAYPFYQVLYVYDLDSRLQGALAQLFDESPTGPVAPQWPTEPDIDLWPPLDRFLTVVAALDELDPVTTELVRLRGARAHKCRICQSRRSVPAITDGASESTFDMIDYFEASDLDERAKVALRLTDAIIWQPGAYPAALVEQVREAFSPAETLEIILDVVRNSANKVAVALQVDQPVVPAGVEYFTIARDGTLAYGVTPPVGAATE